MQVRYVNIYPTPKPGSGPLCGAVAAISREVADRWAAPGRIGCVEIHLRDEDVWAWPVSFGIPPDGEPDPGPQELT